MNEDQWPKLRIDPFDLVENLLRHGCGRGGALEQRGGEGVRMTIKADHPWKEVCIFVHFSSFL